MIYEEWYQDYKWIRVKRWKHDPEKTPQENLEALEKHHVEETAFLIEEVRKLAKELDQIENRGRE